MLQQRRKRQQQQAQVPLQFAVRLVEEGGFEDGIVHGPGRALPQLLVDGTPVSLRDVEAARMKDIDGYMRGKEVPLACRGRPQWRYG